MFRVLISKNIYFITMLILNILYLVFGTQQDLVFISYFVVVSQLTRQCAEGLTQPRVLNNISLDNEKVQIYSSEIFVTLVFACITAGILAYSLELDIKAFGSTLPLVVVSILLQPALSQLNKLCNYSTWNVVLLVPELISFSIFLIANYHGIDIAVHLKYLSQSCLLFIMMLLFRLPLPVVLWESTKQINNIRMSVLTNLLSKNIDKYIISIVLTAPDFVLYERVVYFVKVLTTVFFQPLNVWVQNRSRTLKKPHIVLYLKAFMTYSLLISFIISMILSFSSVNVGVMLNEVSSQILKYFVLALPIFLFSAPVSCTSGFLYALGKVQIVRDMTLAHFAYSIVLYTCAIFATDDVESALIVLVVSYLLNYLMVMYFLTIQKVITIYFSVAHIIGTIIIAGVLDWTN